ncbi:MAG: restriction endonuclease subunit S [Tenuifilum sp.]|uniref:restriction endonuclease subunit S n=2 Tax=Tenuifilaceae TaxID=2760872 RepID=UPI0016AFF939|nr:restriction endonuclease subunit S [Bacteroidales bacterium]NLJ50301.1 restriction endonuclease subunit S [Candidatus Atribacteria bacterium]HOK61731.1 restriction endonuclease subunit S [Tenuifilum sp.]MBP8960402.1 restriction endonuclease subunit S [Bacteroidales bacterium]HOK84852.1 restriction endonuclease subunit S [Tenuifilum sp.]
MKKELLGDRVELIYGFSVRTDNEPKGKYPVYGSNGIIGFIDSFKVKGPGIIIGRKGTVGAVTYSSENFTPTDTTYYVALKDNTKDDLKFWYYYLQLIGLDKLNSHSTVPGLSRDLAYLKEIRVPEKAEQKLIADFLTVIDDKIALNKRINTELENLAKTIYNYWFVQFDFPNNEGKPYKSSGGEMEWNEELKMEIPKGWKTKSLYDIAIYTNGLAMQKHRPNGDEKLPVIKIKEMNEGYSAATEYARPDIEDAYLIREGDVLFSWSASLNVMIWADKVGALNQHIFKVTSEFYPRYYFYHQISNYLNHFKLMAENRKTTMGHITIDHLKESRIVVPDDDSLILKCGERIEPILDLIVKNRMTNIDLMEVRDFLLPMLMNGQVKVKSEAKEQLSIAAEPQVKYGK